ncbi:MAG: DUF4020 domain-containing protein [Cyanobacteriota bacterium]|nr:DUF4020 domain-containing protein [Cyanobacteriota bacterium]
MTLIGTIDFDHSILDAQRNNTLLVFAGAGVSIGPPSKLLTFSDLTEKIADGTGIKPTPPHDKFLGQLMHRKVSVHERAKQLLSPEDSQPNDLHTNLLRLFGSADQVRLVTTNFDLHFETASSSLFGKVPEVFRAPALPCGYDFTGIVHVHGSLSRYQDLVLTDADFGRAYLTEGWARRFLVDAFRKYTVLFVGYSFTDIVINYLSRALPPESTAGRFILTHENHNKSSWDLLGIRPILYEKDANHSELYEGVKMLADRTMRRALDWKSHLAEIGGRTPPTDQESISEVEHALREMHTTKFLLSVTCDVEWLKWLNKSKYLDELFSPGDLCERDLFLANWVAQCFVIKHPNDLIEIAVEHGLRMNSKFWEFVAHNACDRETQLEQSTFRRLISILLMTAPVDADNDMWELIAERCAEQGCTDLILRVFMRFCEHSLSILPSPLPSRKKTNESSYFWAECLVRGDRYLLYALWTMHLKPVLPTVAQSLLSGITQCLERMYNDLAEWGIASPEWDPISYARLAIESHESNQYLDAVDVLIDAVRDALEYLVENSPSLTEAWIKILTSSGMPLLRRLAIHAITKDAKLSPEEALMWLLDNIGLHGHSEHHEIYCAVAQNYRVAPESARKAIIKAVLVHTHPGSDHVSAEIATARLHMEWLSWLMQSKPECTLAHAALAPIKARHPDWRPSEHPDFTRGIITKESGFENQRNVAQLLALEPCNQLEDLLSLSKNDVQGLSPDDLCANVSEACKQDARWAFMLGESLKAGAYWASDLWSALILGLGASELPLENWSKLLRLLANPSLQSAHARAISDVLLGLVINGGKPFALTLLEEANALALSVWHALDVRDNVSAGNDWQTKAFNHPAGIIVRFWLISMSLIIKELPKSERSMPENYQHWFMSVIQDVTAKGGMGRCILAGRTKFLYELDKSWTLQYIIPLFSENDPQKFAQTWDGFLAFDSLSLNHELVECLSPAFVAAVPRLADLASSQRDHFIKWCAWMALFSVTNPDQELLPALFVNGTIADRKKFLSYIGYFLEKMQQPEQQQSWERWLSEYWKNRLQGVPAPLEGEEVIQMLEWVPHLGNAYPAAVDLAIQCPPTPVTCSSLYRKLSLSNLVELYPDPTARLLIYLAKFSARHHAFQLSAIRTRLTNLPDQISSDLDEAFARHGIS